MGAKQAETTTQVSPIESAVGKQLKNNLFPAASSFFNRGSEGIFQGSRFAGAGRTTLANERDIMGRLAPGLDRSASQFGRSLNDLTNPNVGNIEDTFLDTVNAENARQQANVTDLIDQLGLRAGQTFRRDILTGINDQASGAGQFGGGSRNQIARGLAAADVQGGLNLQIGDLLVQDGIRGEAARESALNRAFGLREGALNRQLDATSLFPSLQQAQLAGADAVGRVGAQRDERSQLELNDRIQMEEAARNAELRRLQEFQGLLGFNQAQGFSGSTSTTQGSGSPLAGAAGGALSGASLFPANPVLGGLAGAGVGLLGSL